MNNKVELLAPAGDWDSFLAAVENGADAVYLGGKLFNARQYAGNFDSEQLNRALEYAHVRGAGVYLTMNTLLSDDEMKQALEFASEAYFMGIDGVIVQDLGLAALLREAFPDLSLHASTQMTVYNLEGVRALERLGFKRAVLARELSLEEISHITRNTGLEIEVFVHGALCVCYSGQCLMSSIIGGRSGNRGRCAQPCRLPYRLKPAGTREGVHAGKYLLSPKDLCSLDFLPEILASGVKSLKIEGRMKTPEYVATVVRVYRKYIDRVVRADLAKTPGSTTPGSTMPGSIIPGNMAPGIKTPGSITHESTMPGNMAPESIAPESTAPGNTGADKQDMADLAAVFNRGGFTAGYYYGKSGRDMMAWEKPKNWGTYLGEAVSSDAGRRMLRIRLAQELSIGDGIEVWNGEDESPGTVVTEIRLDGKKQDTAPRGAVVDIGSISGRMAKGDKVYKTSDKKLNTYARESFSSGFRRKSALKGSIEIRRGMPALMAVEDGEGNAVRVEGKAAAEAAVSRPLSGERIEAQLNKTGNTPFYFEELWVELDEGLSLPVSEINDIRRRALEEIERKRSARYVRAGRKDGGLRDMGDAQKPWDIRDAGVDSKGKALKEKALKGKALSGDPGISVFMYRWDKKSDFSGMEMDRVYLPFVSLVRDDGRAVIQELRRGGTEVFAWLPNITRGNLDHLIQSRLPAVVERGLDGLLVANIGHTEMIRSLHGMDQIRIMGDYPLNIFNSFSMEEAAGLGLCGLTLSPEVTLPQIERLVKPSGLKWEAVVYGRIPLMTSEYCPVGSVSGGIKTGVKCSRVCRNASYVLTDRKGMEFPLLCDSLDCRSTILNANVFHMAENLDRLKAAGIDTMRLYIYDEEPCEAAETASLYRDAARNGVQTLTRYRDVIERIKTGGFTRGHYFRGV